MRQKIQLINHASVYLKLSKDLNLLTDPWYDGSVFDDGWSLLYENDEKFILEILDKINFIYISHEHPDHFSISFFKKYVKILKYKNIKIIFQKTLDKRVESFLKKKFGLEIIILENHITKKICGQKITLIDCGTIDSSLLIETDNFYHLNLNDCDFTNSQLKKIKSLIKNNKKIVIYMQFSYAAFRSTDNWLNKASQYKLKKLVEIFSFFNADLLIPFASFIYFSSSENFKLNKYMNTIKTTSDFLDKNNTTYCFLNPEDKEIDIEEIIYNKNLREQINNNSMEFWDKKIKNIKPYKETSEVFEISETLKNNFLSRIREKNTILLMHLIRFLSFNYFFGDTSVHLEDRKETYVLNFFSITRNDKILKSQVDLQMKSKRFVFLLRESYGLDTITVNGCFQNIKKNGFENFIRSIGFVVLNQVERGINLKDLMTSKIINRLEDILLRLFKKNS